MQHLTSGLQIPSSPSVNNHLHPSPRRQVPSTDDTGHPQNCGLEGSSFLSLPRVPGHQSRFNFMSWEGSLPNQSLFSWGLFLPAHPLWFSPKWEEDSSGCGTSPNLGLQTGGWRVQRKTRTKQAFFTCVMTGLGVARQQRWRRRQ